MTMNQTAKQESHSLYAKREKIYPRQVHGIFALWRATGVFVLLGIYYIVPWFQWDGRQAVLLDLPERKFYIFGLIFWPQDFFYMTVLLIIAALSLFFFTALAGRLWCGYACPQTVWTEVFLWIERQIEGDRPKQMRLDREKFGWHKFSLKASKHFIWIVFSAYTGFTFVGYFTPITGLWEKMTTLAMGPWETFWIVFYSFATYGNAGWLREQVCIYMCPYARFQSAMFDNNTLIISYDEARGEPRGSRNRKDDPKSKGLGDCIDCTLCVQVCPTGIDIRKGLQYQCIACAACVDVCNEVMDKMDYEPGLIRYTTQNALEGKPAKLLRPRVVIYASILAGLLVTTLLSMGQRIPLQMDVIRDRIALYMVADNGDIENVYLVKILNMDTQAHRYRLRAAGVPGMEMDTDRREIRVNSGEVTEVPVRLRVKPGEISKRSTEIEFTVEADGTDMKVTEKARFLGPLPGKQ
jgi:cytochrome c oxidase accessory protein FixG